MKPGHQWIHFDAQFPLGLGHDLTERFGPAGQLLFVHFLCACKRSFPQGQIHYRTETEARALLGAHYPFVHSDGTEWTLEEFWKWCGRRKVTRRRARGERVYVSAQHWEAWEDARNAKQRERRRRSKAQSEGFATPLRGEVGGVRGEGRGLRGEGGVGGAGEPDVAPKAEKLLTRLEEVKSQQPKATSNGIGRPDPTALIAMVAAFEPSEDARP